MQIQIQINNSEWAVGMSFDGKRIILHYLYIASTAIWPITETHDDADSDISADDKITTIIQQLHVNAMINGKSIIN
jgi:hypothetical protein